jgi:hypothetical protein
MCHRLLPLLVLLLAGSAGAQTSVGTRLVKVSLTARHDVPMRMVVKPLGPARVVATGTEGTELELEVRAASNADWTLAASFGSDARLAGDHLLEVRDEGGEWRSLSTGDRAPTVVARGQPTNGNTVFVRVRVAPGNGAEVYRRLRLVMLAADGTR